MQISLYTTLQKVAELPLTFTNTTTSSVFQVHAVCPFFLLQFCPSVHLFKDGGKFGPSFFFIA